MKRESDHFMLMDAIWIFVDSNLFDFEPLGRGEETTFLCDRSVTLPVAEMERQ